MAALLRLQFFRIQNFIFRKLFYLVAHGKFCGKFYITEQKNYFKCKRLNYLRELNCEPYLASFPKLVSKPYVFQTVSVPVLNHIIFDSTLLRPWYGVVRVRFGFGDKFGERGVNKTQFGFDED